MEQYKLDKGIFNFLAKRGLNVHQMRRVLKIYAESTGIKKPKDNRLKWYSEISILAQKNLLNLEKFIIKTKNIFLNNHMMIGLRNVLWMEALLIMG